MGLQRNQLDTIDLYGSGARASVFKADGSGFVYYPSGNVAVCKGIIDGRARYYIYGDDARCTPLGAVNEHAVGFILGPDRVRLALNESGGLLTDARGYIVKDWRYDIGAHMPTPSGTLEIKLNDSIIFEFRDRRDMRIKFAQDGFAKELEAGVRPSREGVYLDKSIRLPGGRLELQLERESLVSRQQSFSNAMKAKRDRLKPRSRNLAGDCKDLVANLEEGFDRLGPKVEPFSDPSWKVDAHMATCSEVPKIRSTGLEVGPVKGLGDRRHEREGSSVGDGKALRRSASWGGSLGLAMGMDGTRGGAGSGGNTCTATTRLRKGGKWLGELDVRRQLMVDNPLLKRSSTLQAASGRYAEEILVPGGKTSASNPTGKATVSGVPLKRVPASRLGAFLEIEAGCDQVVVVLCVRGDDPMCHRVEHAADLTNCFLLHGSGLVPSVNPDKCGTRKLDPKSTPEAEAEGRRGHAGREGGQQEAAARADSNMYQMVRVDCAEHQGTADSYGVRSFPSFLMFRGGRLAWTGTLGGSPVKAASPDSAAARKRVLLVEPCAKAQLSAERTLRKFGCSWDLVLNASQALSRLQVARTNAMASRPTDNDGEGYGVLIVSDCLEASDVVALGKAFNAAGGRGGISSSVIVGLASVKGDASCLSGAALRAASSGFTDSANGKRAVLSPHLALVADVAAVKPLKSSALRAVFERCSSRIREGGRTGGTGGGGATLSMSASCSNLEGGDRRYKGVTPSRILEKMEAVRAQAMIGTLAAKHSQGAEKGWKQLRPGGRDAGSADILVSAQETEFKGFPLQKSTLEQMH